MQNDARDAARGAVMQSRERRPSMKGWGDQPFPRATSKAPAAGPQALVAPAPAAATAAARAGALGASAHPGAAASSPELGVARNGFYTTSLGALSAHQGSSVARLEKANGSGGGGSGSLPASAGAQATLVADQRSSGGASSSADVAKADAVIGSFGTAKRKRSAAAVREIPVHENFHIFDLGVALKALEAADIETSRPAPKQRARHQKVGSGAWLPPTQQTPPERS